MGCKWFEVVTWTPGFHRPFSSFNPMCVVLSLWTYCADWPLTHVMSMHSDENVSFLSYHSLRLISHCHSSVVLTQDSHVLFQPCQLSFIYAELRFSRVKSYVPQDSVTPGRCFQRTVICSVWRNVCMAEPVARGGGPWSNFYDWACDSDTCCKHGRSLINIFDK